MKQILLVVVLLTARAALAEPIVNAVSGNIVHGSSVTINGTGFGGKSQAAPLVWDDGTSSPPLSTYYDEALPSNAQQGPNYNMSYRAVPFRNAGSPHSRLNYILGGAHATSTSAGMYNGGNNVSIGKNLTSFKFFAQYYYRVDPDFDEENHPNEIDNMKELSLSGASGQIYGGRWGYYNWCNSHVPDVNYRGTVRLGRLGVDCPSAPYACSTDQYTVEHASPINGWVKMQWEGAYDAARDNPTVRLTTYPDGKVTERDHYGNPITTFETLFGCGFPAAGELRFLGIGGFARVPRFNNGTNSFRYFGGVYIDGTPARVMLGDRSDYAACTKMEPQIPSAWSDGSITVKVNLGSHPDGGTAYLFVFDGENRRNAVGFPVVIGQAQGAPAAPKQLKMIRIE